MILLRPAAKKYFSVLLFFLSAWLSLKYLLPLFFPFVLGLGLALAAEPMVAFLTRRVGLPRSVSAGIGVSMTFLFLTGVLLLLCGFALRQLGALAGVLPNLENAAISGISLLRSWLLGLAARTPQSIRPLLKENINGIFSGGTALVGRAAQYLLGLAGNLLRCIPDSAFSLFTTVISGFMISAKLHKLRLFVLSRLPRQRLKAALALADRVRKVVFSWLKAQLKLVGVTFLMLALGFLLLRIPHGLLWAALVALVDAFPVLGTGTVLLPWSLINLLQGDGARAIGILGIYITVTVVRSVLEPKLLGRHLGLDPLVTLMALYAGFKLWGIGGMILAPLLAVTAIQLVPERKQ